MSQPLIDLQHISKSFDGEMVLDDLSLSIKENSFVTLLGPSGCGKSTTLRIIGGFTPPDKGNVIFDGQDITKLPPNKRRIHLSSSVPFPIGISMSQTTISAGVSANISFAFSML